MEDGKSMKKRRNRGNIRPSSRNALGTVNALLALLNPLLPEGRRLPRLRRAGDLPGFKSKLDQLAASRPQPNSQAEFHQPAEIASPPLVATLVEIATKAWRADTKIRTTEPDALTSAMKSIQRHVEGILGALEAIGITITDMTGRAYDSGMAIRVLTFEETPGLDREQIVETIRPTVKWQNEILQLGEVIVGTPPACATPERGTK